MILLLAFTLALGHGGGVTDMALLLTAGAAGLYLALNIGANDAANHVGILVGAGALSLGSALMLAVGGELSGALMAGAEVTMRLRQQLLHREALEAGGNLITVLLAGMLAAGLWLHIAVLARVPISTTHTIVGGLVGAGIAAGGLQVVQWGNIQSIAIVWLISPVLGAATSALTLVIIERSLAYRSNLIGTARTRVPLLAALLALLLSGHFFNSLAPPQWLVSQRPLLAALSVAVGTFLLTQPLIYSASQNQRNNRKGLNRLLTAPLIVVGFFFAFAHGANDVANVSAPLTELVLAASRSSDTGLSTVPVWPFALGAIGIVIGMAAYGHRVIHTVGKGITKLDQIRAFSVALSAVAVITIANEFGFPVSTTHILVGAILGVGLTQEWNQRHDEELLARIRACFGPSQAEEQKRFEQRYEGATRARRAEMLERLFRDCKNAGLDQKQLDKLRADHRLLIQPRRVGLIVLFWIGTLPVAGLLGAGIARITPHLLVIQ